MSNNAPTYAGFWLRLFACLIDALLYFLFTLTALVLIFGWGNIATSVWTFGPTEETIKYVFPAVLTVSLWRRYKATPGKLALRMVIVDAKTGAAPSLGQCIVRYLGYIPATLPLCLGLLWVAVDKRKQGWHDKLAGTVVVCERADH